MLPGPTLIRCHRRTGRDGHASPRTRRCRSAPMARSSRSAQSASPYQSSPPGRGQAPDYALSRTALVSDVMAGCAPGTCPQMAGETSPGGDVSPFLWPRPKRTLGSSRADRRARLRGIPMGTPDIHYKTPQAERRPPGRHASQSPRTGRPALRGLGALAVAAGTIALASACGNPAPSPHLAASRLLAAPGSQRLRYRAAPKTTWTSAG